MPEPTVPPSATPPPVAPASPNPVPAGLPISALPPQPGGPAPVAPQPLASGTLDSATSSIAAQLNALFPSGVMPAPTQPGSALAQPAPPTPPPVAPVTPPPVDPNAPKPPEAPKPGESKPPEAPKPGDKKPLTQEELDRAAAAMTPAAGTAFKVVRGELAETKELLTKAEQRATDAERKAQDVTIETKEVQELRDRVAAQEKELSILNVEATEQFQNTIAKPLKQAETSLAQLATKYKVPEGDLRAALAEPDAALRSDKLSELSANFNRLDTIAFDRAITQVSEFSAMKEQALGSAAAEASRLQSERDRADSSARAKFAEDWKAARATALTKLTEDKTTTGVIFNKTGDEKFDVDVQKAIETVQNLDIERLSNEDLAARLYRAEALPLALRLVASLYTQVGEQEAEVARLRGGTPPVGAGDPIPPVPPVPATNASFADIAKQRLQGVLPP